MDQESSSSQKVDVKSSVSGIKHGTPSKNYAQESLLDENHPSNSSDKDLHASKESIPMPDQDDAIIPRIIPDINAYQNKKTAGTGMMDFALLITNVNQLRHIINSFDSNPFFYASLSLVIISIILQIIVGWYLILNSRYDVKDRDDICKANQINNKITILIFLVTVVNIVLSAFELEEMSYTL